MGSSLYNKIKFGVAYASQQSEQRLRRHRYDTLAEGIGLDRVTANFGLGFENIAWDDDCWEGRRRKRFGKVALTIDGKTRDLKSVRELEELNKADKVINLPSKKKESVQEAIYNAQLNDLPWDWSSSPPLVGTKRIISTGTQHTL